MQQKTLTGLLWSFLERSGNLIIQFAVGVVLARLLMPADFGLIAMVTVFITFSQVFIDGGFEQALIQKEEATHLDQCSIFYFNLLLSLLFMGVIYLAAPWIAGFYGQPELVQVVRALSPVLPLSALGLVHMVTLARRVDFKTQFRVSVASLLLSGAVGITAAYRGHGIWALVAQALTAATFSSLFLWLLAGWRPSLQFSVGALRGMFGFGSRIFLSRLLYLAFDSAYVLLIGKLFAADTLGHYSRGRRLQQLPTNALTDTMSRVLYPVFSSLQNEPARLADGLRLSVRAVSLVNLPLMIGLAVVARPLVSTLLTDKWLPCVPYLQLFCAVGVLYPFHQLNIIALKSLGRSDLFFRLQWIKMALQLLAILVTYRWGVSALISGQIAVSMLSLPLNLYFPGKLLGYGPLNQLRDMAPCLVLACLMGAVTSSLSLLQLPGAAVELAAMIPLGVLIYWAACALLKVEAYVSTVERLREALGKRRGG